MPSLPKDVGGYVLGRQIGSGSFGEVYMARRGTERVAVKLERSSSSKRSHLRRERRLYASLQDAAGFPRVQWYGSVGKWNAMVLELLGASLEELFRREKRFTLKTVLLCADQMIQRLEYLHNRGIIHCDVKPNNFAVGRGTQASQIYLLDFGLSRHYVDSVTQAHIPYRDGRRGLTGTARYTSISNHQGVELARRDDMEGLGYVLVRMHLGTLPWQGIKAETKQLRNDLIRDRKLSVSVKQLCEGLPVEFEHYINICRGLAFEQRPPYEELRGLMRKALADNFAAGGDLEDMDTSFDWSGKVPEGASSGTTSAGSSCGGVPPSEGRSEVAVAKRREEGAKTVSGRGPTKRPRPALCDSRDLGA